MKENQSELKPCWNKKYKSVDEMVRKLSSWRFKILWFWTKLVNALLEYKKRKGE